VAHLGVRVRVDDESHNPCATLVGAPGVARSCGAAIARSSWSVVAAFPLAPMATTGRVAFLLVDTTHGWKLYGSVLDHH
jgi:hypothetical protein